MMIGSIIKYSVVIGLLSGITLQAMAQYTGTVFLDENKNGVRDSGEQVLWGVSVSDVSTGVPIFSTVAVSGRTLYAADFGGNVYAFMY